MRSRATTFHEIYSKYAEDVFRYACWMSGNPDDARDITSETFVRAWTAPEEPRLETVKAYLFAIARNLHNKQWRLKSRQVPLDESFDQTPDGADSPAEKAIASEDFRRAVKAIHKLDDLDRTVLLLRADGNLSYEDISATTGLSVSAAKVRVFRARAKLAALLQLESETQL